MKKSLFILFIFGIFSTPVVYSQSANQNQQKPLYTAAQRKLLISAENVRLVPEQDKEKGGFHLYVKKLPNVNSILLTETTKDPEGKSDSYAYRATEYNKINGDELRYLNGQPLVSDYAKYSLVDSTPEETSFFGQAFHIYIPPKIVYGYSWSRNGEVEIGKGTFINIRSYSKPYADYDGDFMDNPFMFDLVIKHRPKPVIQKKPAPEPLPEPVVQIITEPAPEEIPEEIPEEPEVILTDDYNPVASDKFKEIADDMIYSKGPSTIVEDIVGIISSFEGKKDLDLVFAIDATGSMKNDIDELKANLEPELRKIFGENPTARVGLLFYRDYGDTYKFMNLPVKMFQFTQSYEVFTKNLNSIKIRGTEGGDIPEAVYEALYASCKFFSWREPGTSERQIILIGDAEPHPHPRASGRYSKEFVLGIAEENKIGVHAILLPAN